MWDKYKCQIQYLFYTPLAFVVQSNSKDSFFTKEKYSHLPSKLKFISYIQKRQTYVRCSS